MIRTMALALALAGIPALVSAQTTGSQGRGRDRADTAAARDRAERDDQRGTRARTAQGRTGTRARNLGMTMAQVRQLQQALREMGCYESRVDGIVGPRTRQAIACARRERNIQGSDPNALLEELGMDFTVEDATGWDALMRGSSGTGNRQDDVNRGGNNSSGSNRGNTTGDENDTTRARENRNREQGQSQRGRDSTQRDTIP